MATGRRRPLLVCTGSDAFIADDCSRAWLSLPDEPFPTDCTSSGALEDAFDSSYQVLQASAFGPLHQTTEEPVSCSQYKVTMGRAVDWNGFRFAWIPTSDEKSVVVRYQALDALVTFDKNYYSFD
jgi:hypothetical protein